MNNYTWLLDPGHGGLIAGRYVTAPNKMHQFEDGFVIYEGVVNRLITNKLALLLTEKHIRYVKVADEHKDTPLQARVAKADSLYSHDRSCIYLAIHSNAGGGEGFEIFTSKGQTKSDNVAKIFCNIYQEHFPQFKFRKELKDGDDDKEEDFYVLRKTDCPALLVENLFFDNRKEAEYLMSELGQFAIAHCLLNCIEEVELLKPI